MLNKLIKCCFLMITSSFCVCVWLCLRVCAHAHEPTAKSRLHALCKIHSSTKKNRQFPEITDEDNLTMFSYSGRVKSPEWRWQQRRADLRHFEIFRHGPIIIFILDYQLGEPTI